MMNAMQVFTDGSPSQQIQVPIPTPAKNEVRVQVKYAALDTGTEAVIDKDFSAKFIHDTNVKPLIIGWHYAGTIDAVGAEVTDFKVGNDVYGFLGYEPKQKQGSFAEYIVIAEKKTALKPNDVPMDIAAASSCESLTALQALRDEGGLEKDQRVLIIGSSGGVGSAAVMIAKNLGAQVTAVCSAKHVDRVKAMGADVVIDRSKNPNYLSVYTDDKSHIVFDTPASTSWWDTRGILEKGGAYVVTLPSLGFARDVCLSTFSSQSVKFVECEPKQADFELVGTWLSQGTLKIDVDSQYKVSDLDEAIERQKDKSKIGRVVIQVENGWN